MEAPKSKTIDKSVATPHLTFRSVKSQFDPIQVSEVKHLPETLRVHIFPRKQRTFACNTEISFPPDCNVVFSVQSHDNDNANNMSNLDESVSSDIEHEHNESFVLDDEIL